MDESAEMQAERSQVTSEAPQRANRFARPFYFCLGMMSLATGIVGAFLPLLPTTIFIIIAAWAFGRSSPRFEQWLLNHKRFGPTLRAWRDSGAIRPAAKAMACSGMAVGYGVFYWGAQPSLALALFVAALMLGSAAYVLSRPNE